MNHDEAGSRLPWVEPEEAARRLRRLGGLAWLDAGRPEADGGQVSWVAAGPSRALRARASEADVLGRLDRFVKAAGGVAIGWLGYDLGRAVERMPSRAAADLALPDLCVRAYECALRFDHVAREVELVGRQAEVLAGALARPGEEVGGGWLGELDADMGPEAHAAGVARILEYIGAGDVYQVNLARRLRGRASGDALGLYLRLRAGSPAPMGAYLEEADHAILSNSPERFLRVRGGVIEAEPIKGTRPRGATDAEDRRLIAELGADDKERAEHVMIVDLLRNDLGRVAEYGSVSVTGMMRVLSIATVHHLVSTVRGRLRAGASLEAILRAAFPGGSITGAPKVRAMEIIEELEPVRRGPYTGAVGWMSPTGDLDLSIAIRTGVWLGDPRAGGELHVHAGGGIVADSTAAGELAETEAKALAWRRLAR
jgi:para-aminobenzoate synthetase component 1